MSENEFTTGLVRHDPITVIPKTQGRTFYFPSAFALHVLLLRDYDVI